MCVALTQGLRDCRRVAKPEERVRGKTLPEVLKSTIQYLDPPKIGRVKRGRGLTAQFADLVCVALTQGLRDCRRVAKSEERTRGKTLPEVLKSTIQNLDPPKIGRVKRGRGLTAQFADLVRVALTRGLRDCRRVAKPEERARGKTLPEVLKSAIQTSTLPKLGG